MKKEAGEGDGALEGAAELTKGCSEAALPSGGKGVQTGG